MNESLPTIIESPVTVFPSAAPFPSGTEPSTAVKPSLYKMISEVAAKCSVEKNTAKQFIIAYCRTDISTADMHASFIIPDAAHTRLASLYYLPYCMEEPRSQDSLDMPLGRGIVNHCLRLFETMPKFDESVLWQMQNSNRLCRPEGSSEGRQRPTVQSREQLFDTQQCDRLHTAWLECLRTTKSALDGLSSEDPTRATVDWRRCEDAKQWLLVKGLIPEWLAKRERLGFTSKTRRYSGGPARPPLRAPVRETDEPHRYHANPAESVVVEATNAGFRLRPGGDSYQQ